MDERVSKILQELYELEPGFRARESEIVPVITALLAHRPDSSFDSRFAAGLRARLLSSVPDTRQAYNLSFTFMFMRKINFILGSVAVLAIIMSGFLYYTTLGSRVQPGQILGSDTEINAVGSHAFGKLAIQTGGRGGGGTLSNAENAPLGLGGGNPSATFDTNSAPQQAGGKMIAPGEPMPPVPTQYVFKYTGGDLPEIPSQVDVLRHIKGGASASSVIGLLNGINFDLTDLSSFSDTRLESYTVSENKQYGYSIFVNLLEGDISIMQNWNQWPNPLADCRDNECAMRLQLKPSDVPEDKSIADIANSFLTAHHIPLANYGEPIVSNDWKNTGFLPGYMEKSSNFQGQGATVPSLYVPDTVNVVYPLKLRDQTVYDESGSPTGLIVGVNIRERKVASVGQLTSQKYESSQYETEKDTARIIRTAEQGGRYGFGDFGNIPTKKVEIKLGVPQVSLVRMWNYNSKTSEELLVPSYIFPVLTAPANEYFFQKNIVVPMVKEILDISAQPPYKIMEGVPAAAPQPQAAPAPEK